VQILQSKSYLSNIKECNVIWEEILLPEESENLTTLDEVKDKVKVGGILECLN